MRLYLAGPMRGLQENNHEAFYVGREYLRLQGHEVFCPDEMTENVTESREGITPDLRELMAMDLSWICRMAEGVVVLPGWRRSLGVRAEVSVALAIGIPCWEWKAFQDE